MDHTIDIEPGATMHWKVRTYPMSPKEQEELDKFLNEHVKKGTLSLRSLLWQVCLLYQEKGRETSARTGLQAFNKITIKNRYPLPLAADIINRLKGAITSRNLMFVGLS